MEELAIFITHFPQMRSAHEGRMPGPGKYIRSERSTLLTGDCGNE